MTPKELIDAFEVLADAPEGIARVRELILALAVQGKLVAQNSADEPAIALLERAAVERTQYAADNELRAGKHLEPLDEYEAEKELPPRWVACQLHEVILQDLGGGTPSKKEPKYWGGAVKWASVKDVGKTKHLGETIDRITDLGLRESSSNLIPAGWLLVCVRMGLGKLSISADNIAINQDIRALYPSIATSSEFLYLVLKAHELTGSGMTVKGIKREALLSTRIALPPRPEQDRIVARVDELMALLDRLEAAQRSREETRQALRDAALSALRDADDPETVQSAWTRISGNMDQLFTGPEDIAPLREALLQLGVQGRLVPQDRAVERREVRDLVKFLNGFAFKSAWYSNHGTRVVRNQNVGHGDIDWTDAKMVPEEHLEGLDRFELFENDVVLSLDRPIINTGLKLARVRKRDLPCMLLQRVACPRPINDLVTRDYFCLWLSSPEFVETIDPGRSNGVPHISTKEVEAMTLRVPSITEQERVVAKVDELMALCDGLEARLQGALDSRRAFATSAVASFA